MTLLTFEKTLEDDLINLCHLCEADFIGPLYSSGLFRLCWNTIKVHLKLNGRFDDEEKSGTNPLTRKNEEKLTSCWSERPEGKTRTLEANRFFRPS